jgi:hypothetical protein
MTEPLFAGLNSSVTLALLVALLANAASAALARSLFAMVVFLFVSALLAGITLLTLGYSGPALELVLIGAGLAPPLLLGTMLLSARAAKMRARPWPWLSVAAAGGAGMAMLAPVVPLGANAPAIVAPLAEHAPWLSALMFAAAITGLGLLGFGERGAIEPHVIERDV